MAKNENVDPQYLWIPPTYFELKPEAQLQIDECVYFRLGAPDAHKIYLNNMTNFHRNIIGFTFPSDHDHAESRTEWKVFLSENALKEEQLTFYRYLHFRETFQAFEFAGLVLRSGLLGLETQWMRIRKLKLPGYPMAGFLVTEPEKARKYFNIGINLTTDIPKHPSTLEEAASSYAKICELVSDTMTIKEAEKKITETENEQEIWELKREKFRLETKERYREAVIDMARESWHEKELSDIREKKRARNK